MNTTCESEFTKKIEELTNQYYSDNKKNTFSVAKVITAF